MLTIPKQWAADLLLALGTRKSLVEKWDSSKLKEKLTILKEVPRAVFTDLRGRNKKVLDSLLIVLKEGNPWVVEDPPGKEDVSKTPPPPRKPSTKYPRKGLVDRFGMGVCSSGARINEVLSDTIPKKESTILKECGVNTSISRIYNHVRKLAEAGFLAKVEGGWLVVKDKTTGRPVTRSEVFAVTEGGCAPAKTSALPKGRLPGEPHLATEPSVAPATGRVFPKEPLPGGSAGVTESSTARENPDVTEDHGAED